MVDLQGDRGLRHLFHERCHGLFGGLLVGGVGQDVLARQRNAFTVVLDDAVEGDQRDDELEDDKDDGKAVHPAVCAPEGRGDERREVPDEVPLGAVHDEELRDILVLVLLDEVAVLPDPEVAEHLVRPDDPHGGFHLAVVSGRVGGVVAVFVVEGHAVGTRIPAALAGAEGLRSLAGSLLFPGLLFRLFPLLAVGDLPDEAGGVLVFVETVAVLLPAGAVGRGAAFGADHHVVAFFKRLQAVGTLDIFQIHRNCSFLW